MKEFWFTAISIVLCGIIAMSLIIMGLGLDDSIPPETKPNGELVPPPGYDFN